MKIDIMHTLYTISMILLAFIAAIVITKAIGKYTSKEENGDEK